MNISNKSILQQLQAKLDNMFKPNIRVGYGFIEDNTKSCKKKRRIWESAITSQEAKEFWYAKFLNANNPSTND